jgi:ferritin-like metal-binding protein YciE
MPARSTSTRTSGKRGAARGRSTTTTRRRSTGTRATSGGRSTGRATGNRTSRTGAGRTSGSGGRGGGIVQGFQEVDRYAGFSGEVTQEQVDELLLQALETEIGGIQVYETALRCVQDEELKEEWEKYLDQTRNHESLLTGVFGARGLDVNKESPGRSVVRHLGESLVKAMEMALQNGSPEAAELVAAECVVLAETKDHHNWQLIGEVAKALGGDEGRELQEAYDEVEEEEDEHLYHTMGWSRELWIKSLGMPAVLPPPEEEKAVKSAIGAERAKQGRKQMLPKGRN